MPLNYSTVNKEVNMTTAINILIAALIVFLAREIYEMANMFQQPRTDLKAFSVAIAAIAIFLLACSFYSLFSGGISSTSSIWW